MQYTRCTASLFLNCIKIKFLLDSYYEILVKDDCIKNNTFNFIIFIFYLCRIFQSPILYVQRGI